uniref:Uncharacterized protein n=1 Tax=Equus asinus TaxID=9793 RepID=A0A8C4LLY0_EQUAS
MPIPQPPSPLVTTNLCISFSADLADGVICPAAVTDTTAFLTFNEPLYKLQAGRFDAPPEAVKAKLETKKCTDKISIGNRWLILKALRHLRCCSPLIG